MKLDKKNITFLGFIIIVIVVFGYALSGSEPEPDYESHAGLKIDSWEGKKDSKVFYVYAPELPMVDVRVVFNAGSARDADKPGLATLTNLLLDHGAGDWNTDQIVERFDRVGAQFSAQSLRDMAIVNLRSLTTNEEWLDTALETMEMILQKPVFSETEFERERQRLLIALKNQQESPSDIAEITFYKSLYGDHPYASSPLGTKESVEALTRDDLVEFYKRYYVASNAIVVIVGNVERKQAKSIAAKLMSGMDKGEPASALPQVDAVGEAIKVKKQHPSTQTHIWVGQEGMTRTDEDYLPLYLGNHILGGSGFGSRVVEQIREKRGLAYSSYTYFSPMQRKGPFLMGLQTKNTQTTEALEVLMETVQEFIDNGPTEEEVNTAKMNVTGGFPLRIDSNKDITEYVAMIGFYDLPLDYLTTFNSRVEAVTREQIMDAFSRRLHPDRMVTVLVGDLNDKD